MPPGTDQTQRPVSAYNRHLRYGGPCFSAASELPLKGGLLNPRRLLDFLAAAVQRPWRVGALIILLLRTSPEYMSLSDSPSGRAIRAYFDSRSRGLLPQNRLCRGVLILPPEHSEYLRGRRRQAMRTNLRKAAAAGIRCEVTSDRLRALDDMETVLSHRRIQLLEVPADEWRPWLAEPQLTHLVARDRTGEPVAAAAVTIDDYVCLIRFAVASDHCARWALHDYLVRMLIARGVRYVMVEGGGPFGALGLARGVQHYQHLLGYELRHVIPHTGHELTRRQRLAASGVVAATTALLLLAAGAAAAPTP